MTLVLTEQKAGLTIHLSAGLVQGQEEKASDKDELRSFGRGAFRLSS